MEFECSFPAGALPGEVVCPAPGCLYEPLSRNLLRRHFLNRHPDHTVIIREEGRLPQCELCGFRVTPYADRRGHMTSGICQADAQRRRVRELLRSYKQA